LARNRIQAAVRGWLADEGFVEVDPAALQPSPGNEAHLHAFETAAVDPDGTARRLFLHTSPEFAMKKLLAAGETRIAAFAHVWRNRERGPLHSAEFTMLEWYRSGAPYAALMDDCAAILRLAAAACAGSVPANGGLLRHRDLVCDPLAPAERIGVAEAVARETGIDLMGTLDANGNGDAAALAAAMARAGLRAAADDTWSDMLSRILVQKVEPRLGIGRPTVLDRYPACEAALARRTADDPRLAERFELYVCGVELANGFGELTDPAEQRRRFEARVYGERYPLDEDLLAALALMPPASGIALGFDRLVMLATAAPRVETVLWAPPG
jgi:lysyl-tRNA synthetase class 2